jgi:mannosyltransferase OCH1-like enzyme
MQTLFGYDSVPAKWMPSYNSVKNVLVPRGWRHVLLKEKQYDAFVRKYFPDFLDTFRAYPETIYRCDAIRYMWLYVFGGIYLDLDMVVKRDVSELLHGCSVAVAEETSNIISNFILPTEMSNCFMASVPGHPIWLDCIHLMKKRANGVSILSWASVLYKTGPSIISEVSKRYTVCKVPNKLVNNIECNVPIYSPGRYIENLQGASWTSERERSAATLVCKMSKAPSIRLFSCICLAWCAWVCVMHCTKHKLRL